MTDRIPSFKKEIDTIHVPIDKLDAIILKTVQGSVPKRKRSLRKKVTYGIVAVVAAFGLLIGSATVSPVMANIVSQLPIIGSIFNTSGDIGLKQVGEMGLTQVVGQSKVMGDVTITIDEVYYDGTRFTIGYSFESEQPFGDVQLPSPRLSIDGEPIGSSASIGLNDISPTVQTHLLNIHAPDLPEAFDLDLTFQQGDSEKVDFTIPVSTQTDTKLVSIDNSHEAGSFTLELSNLKISPAGVLLAYNKTFPESEVNHLLSEYITFKVVDELGNELVSRSGSGAGEIMNGQEYWTSSELYDPIDDHVKELTIIPYLDLPKAKRDENGNERAIDYSQYNVEDIKFDSVTVKLP